jgi:hypothetical protein
MEKNNNMKIKNLILEQLSTRDKSKLENLKTNGYEVITTRKYNSEPTKFDYETVGSGANIVYLAKAKVVTNTNTNTNTNTTTNPAPVSTDLNDYVGKYKSENGEESEIKIDGAGLKANIQGIPFKFTKTSKDLFDVAGFGQTGRCEFLRDSSGKVIGLTAEVGGQSVKATKVGVTASTSGGSSSSSVPAINPQASSGSSSGSQITGSISGWPACVQRTQQKNIYIITDKKDIPVTYFKDQAGADDFLTKNTEKGYEIKKEACVFKFEDCDLDLQGPFSCEMYLRKNGTFISNGDYKIGQWKCSERNRVQYFDLQLSEEKIRKNIKKGLNKLIK